MRAGRAEAQGQLQDRREPSRAEEGETGGGDKVLVRSLLAVQHFCFTLRIQQNTRRLRTHQSHESVAKQGPVPRPLTLARVVDGLPGFRLTAHHLPSRPSSPGVASSVTAGLASLAEARW